MSQIKNAGFTIVEILVAVVILITVIMIGFNLIFSAVGSNSKTNIVNEIRQNGNHVLEVMEPIIGSASKIICSENQIEISNARGESTTFKLDQSERIASGSYFLTSDNLIAENFVVTCSSSPGLPAKVDISFRLKKTGEFLRTSESASRDFNTQIILRNYQ